MAKKQIKKSTETPQNIKLLNVEAMLYQMRRGKVEIQKWRNALVQAENVFNPFRYNLLEVYNEICLDATLAALIQKRIRNVTNKELVWKNANGEIDEAVNEQLDKRWFHNTVKIIMETIFWGHSLGEFITEGYDIKATKLIPRHHVRPEYGIVCLAHPHDTEGLPYREPPYSNFSFEVDLGLGLFNIAAANAILKRGGTVDYANFVEIFGSPIREIQYDTTYENAKNEANEIAEKSGNSSFIVLPQDVMQLTLHKGADGNSGNLHGNFLKDLREELMILVLGQTMTTQSGSSYNQGFIHREEQKEIIKDDQKLVLSILNEQLIDKLTQLGLPLTGGKFAFNDTEELSLKDQLEIAKGVAEMVEIEDDYWYENFNIPKPQGQAQKKEGPEKKK